MKDLSYLQDRGIRSRKTRTPKQTAHRRVPNLPRLVGKIALITGGDSNIGRLVAERFAAEGADIVLCYRDNDAEAIETLDRLEGFGHRVHAVRGEMRDPDIAKRAINETLDHVGPIDYLVINPERECDQETEAILKQGVDDYFDDLCSSPANRHSPCITTPFVVCEGRAEDTEQDPIHREIDETHAALVTALESLAIDNDLKQPQITRSA